MRWRRAEMRILVPPSEAKRPGGTGLPLGRRQQRDEHADRLVGAQATMIAAITALSEPARAAQALRLPAGAVLDVLQAHTSLLTSPTRPAMGRYSGVLYQALNVPGLSPAARREAGRTLLIFSGLRGVSRGRDPIPSYRVPASATLPGLGSAAGFWRPVLAEAVPGLLDGGMVLDLRSTDYAALWRPTATVGSVTELIVTARIVTLRPDGTKSVVSFDSKWGKGRLVAAILTGLAAGGTVTCLQDVCEAWIAAGGVDADTSTPTARNGARHLDLLWRSPR